MKIRFTLSFLLVIFFSLQADEAKHNLENIDTSDYPNIKVYIREGKKTPLEKEELQISETREGYLKSVPKITILKPNTIRPIKLVLSIQASSNLDNLRQSQKIALSLLDKLRIDDKIGLQIFGKESNYLNLDLDIKEATEKISNIQPARGSRPNHSLNALFNQLGEDENLPLLIFLFHPEKDSTPDEPIANLIKKSKTIRAPIHIFAPEESKYILLSEYTGGEFFSSEKNTSQASILSYYRKFKKSPAVLEYASPFTVNTPMMPPGSVKINLKIAGADYELRYNLGIIQIIKAKLSNVELFFSIMGLALLICLLLLYSVSAKQKRKDENQYSQDTNFSENEELDFEENNTINTSYSYNNGFEESYANEDLQENSYSPEEDDFDLNMDLSPEEEYTEKTPVQTKVQTRKIESMIPEFVIDSAEKYDKAFLIFKQGPTPGRQFNLNQDEVTVGNTASNDLVIWDDNLSPLHAKIRRVKNSYVLFDMVSKTGVYLNGKKLLRPKPLFDFDEIKIGNTLLIFRGK